MQGHIIVTGATGVIGTELVKELDKRGEQVVVFVRSPESAALKIPGAAGYVRWDSFMESGEWTSSIEGAKAIIHLAGKPLLEGRWNEEHKKECYDSRILGTRNLVRAISNAAKKPDVFLSSSAIGYYGSFDRCDETGALLETAPGGNDFLAGICIDWEKEALKAEQLGVRLVLLRTGIVLSTKGGMLQKMLTPFNFFLGGPVGSGLQCISWVHIDDEIAGILEALDNPAYRGPVNIVSPEPVSMKEFASSLGGVLGKPSFLPVPKFAVQLLMGEGGNYAVKGQNVKPGFLGAHGFVFRFPDLASALGDLVKNGK
ncbi:MAG: TIGR01777 family protein [Chlorobiaceae bacterium]|nr:TIGR01777 family protein [Chlorobiaceae bacterium]NTV61382.1 TIGR01777 family protein [Chlorobiaceae bacterium]